MGHPMLIAHEGSDALRSTESKLRAWEWPRPHNGLSSRARAALEQREGGALRAALGR